MNKARTTMLAGLAWACITLSGCSGDKELGAPAPAPAPANRAHPAAPASIPVGHPAVQPADGQTAAAPAASPRTGRDAGGGDHGASATPSTWSTSQAAGRLGTADGIAATGDPEALADWIERAATHDYATAASNGEARAQLLHGLSLIRKDLVTVQDSVPLLSSIPVIGKMWFQKTQYFIGEDADPALVAEAQAWIARARAQHFAPAAEAERLFLGSARSPLKSGPP